MVLLNRGAKYNGSLYCVRRWNESGAGRARPSNEVSRIRAPTAGVCRLPKDWAASCLQRRPYVVADWVQVGPCLGPLTRGSAARGAQSAGYLIASAAPN